MRKHDWQMRGRLCGVVGVALLAGAGHGFGQEGDGMDPFVSGAQVAWLSWAAQECGGHVDEAVLARLAKSRALDEKVYRDGQRAAERSIALNAREGRQEEMCRVIVRDYGPNGHQLKGAFHPKP